MSKSTMTLPSWDAIPSDIGAATLSIKAALRTSIEASGRSVAEVVAEIEKFLAAVADHQEPTHPV